MLRGSRSRPATSAPVRLEREPGRTAQYSGGGYEIVQLLFEDTQRRPFAAIVERAVLRPLGMARSTFRRPRAGHPEDNVASAHTVAGDVVAGRVAHLWSPGRERS